MKRYIATRDDGHARVVVETRLGRQALAPRNDLWNHSPDGFEWSYGGSGPAQLALAILADATGDDELAKRLHQDFKWAHIASAPADGFTLDDTTVREFVREHQESDAAA